MRKIICTTGASIANGIDFTPEKTAPSELSRMIQERIKKMRIEHPESKDFCERVSAEMHSLMRLSVNADDEVYLLYTDTDEGNICTIELKKIIESEFQAKCISRRIDKLQVKDAKKFRLTGIQNLFSAIDRICDGVEPEQVVLNVTGGFKAVVPYITLFGLLRHYRLVYIFERSKELLYLPPVPITYDYECLGQARTAIAKLEETGGMSRREFEQYIPAGFSYHDRQWFDILVEEVDGLVAPSAFAMLLFGGRDERQATVYLSPAAKKALDNSENVSKQQFLFMLSRVADPLWRQHKLHSLKTETNRLECYKPGNTAERMFAYTIGKNKVIVCELTKDHEQEYTRVINAKLSPKDYPEAQAELWTPAADGIETTQLELCLDNSIAALSEQLELNKLVFADNHDIMTQFKELQSINNRNIEQICCLNAELATLRKTNAYLKQPWWRKIFKKMAD